MHFYVCRFSLVPAISLLGIHSAIFQKRPEPNGFRIVICPHNVNGQIITIWKNEYKCDSREACTRFV